MHTDHLEAWNQDTYPAWVERFGPPESAAARLKLDPQKNLGSLAGCLLPLRGKRVMNLMGSHGGKAVAMALLGAEVTVADFSAGNRRYALELAKAAGVELHYILSEVLALDMNEHGKRYDVVVAEMGILHYFRQLEPFMALAYGLLAAGGRFVLRDFHPVSTKLLSYRGSTAKVRKYKVDGDYFSAEPRETDVAYSKFADLDSRQAKVSLRYWTLGEVVTAAARSGLMIQELKEEPNLSSEVFDKGIPKTFILCAQRGT